MEFGLNSQFVLLGGYRPGSQPLSSVVFDELSSVFEQLMTLRCSVVVCGDFNIYVDQVNDVYAVRFVQAGKSSVVLQLTGIKSILL